MEKSNHLVRQDRRIGPGGGLLFLIHNSVIFTRKALSTTSKNDPHLEELTIRIAMDNTELHINNVYIPPASSCNGRYSPALDHLVPTTPACTWWNRPDEDPSSGKLESTHPSRTCVKYDQVFFGVESIMRVNSASLDIRDATTSTPGTLNDLTTDLIMANNNNNNSTTC